MRRAYFSPRADFVPILSIFLWCRWCRTSLTLSKTGSLTSAKRPLTNQTSRCNLIIESNHLGARLRWTRRATCLVLPCPVKHKTIWRFPNKPVNFLVTDRETSVINYHVAESALTILMCVQPDVCIIELGGTLGDIESMPFVEALRQFQGRCVQGWRNGVIFSQRCWALLLWRRTFPRLQRRDINITPENDECQGINTVLLK